MSERRTNANFLADIESLLFRAKQLTAESRQLWEETWVTVARS